MADIAAEAGSRVWVLVVRDDRSGVELTAHHSWEAALARKARLAREGWSQLREGYPDEVPAEAPADDWDAAEMFFTRGTKDAFIDELTVEG